MCKPARDIHLQRVQDAQSRVMEALAEAAHRYGTPNCNPPRACCIPNLSCSREPRKSRGLEGPAATCGTVCTHQGRELFCRAALGLCGCSEYAAPMCCHQTAGVQW